MSTKTNTEILPEDQINLNQDQINLIELAFINQIPPEDAKFIQNIRKTSDKNNEPDTEDPFVVLSDYYIKKYGLDFGVVYLAAVTGGEEKYKEAKESIETSRAQQRIQNNTTRME